LSVRDEIVVLVTYDERLAETGERHGVPLASPGF
jgi:hypothetical protein